MVSQHLRTAADYGYFRKNRRLRLTTSRASSKGGHSPISTPLRWASHRASVSRTC